MTDIYQIRLKGHLDHHWSDWLNNLTLTHHEDGTTMLSGPIPDQAALYGLLIKMRDMDLTLLSVNRIETSSTEIVQSSF
jgi:hypothetical protein